jgi:hypothetical protein
MWQKTKRGFDLESRAQRMLSVMTKLGNYLDGTPAKGDKVKMYCHELYVKYFQHAASAIKLRSGTVVASANISFFDTALSGDIVI